MCVICSENISLETRKNQLTNLHNDVINNKLDVFNEFNTTSILFLLYSCNGMHDEECKKLSLDVMRQFILWIRKNKQELYLPDSGLELMFHSKILEDVINWCETFPMDFWKEVENKSDENKSELNHEKYELLLNKMEESHNNLKNNDLVYYIYKTYFDKVYLISKEDDGKFMRNLFLGSIFTGLVTGLAFRYLMSSSPAPALA
jgi:hypothetical protein